MYGNYYMINKNRDIRECFSKEEAAKTIVQSIEQDFSKEEYPDK